MTAIMTFLSSLNLTLVFAVLWGLCETLALIPSVKSNSVFTLIFNTLAAIKAKFLPGGSA